ncbi:MAG: formimidoylglutamate deiminase [Propylenella sp.]
MQTLHFATALLPEGWCDDVRVEIASGVIASVTPDAKPEPGDERHAIAIPGMANVHSHAFQRAMAGLAEHRSAEKDDFWTWREAMYGVALAVSPDDVEAIATQAYVEMLEAGFTRVGEFHYLHHDRDGTPYGDRIEMAQRVLAAAAEVGIGMTLLPVFYAHGDFGGAPTVPGQRRFLSSIDGFARLLDESRVAAAKLEGASIGVAPHSLRAATPEELTAVLSMASGGPAHIHVAEQEREVEACIAWSGRRPVEWLLDNFDVGTEWCLIHATHMTGKETEAVAASGAAVALCPITEANLGDGIFNAQLYLLRGGRYGIGSDSNVMIEVAGELRQLEYSQRLRHRTRNIVTADGRSTGRMLFDEAVAGGAQALGQQTAGIAPGAAADIVSLRSDRIAIEGRSGDRILGGWIFASKESLVDCVWARGVKQVSGGRHRRADAVAERFRAVMKKLIA